MTLGSAFVGPCRQHYRMLLWAVHLCELVLHIIAYGFRQCICGSLDSALNHVALGSASLGTYPQHHITSENHFRNHFASINLFGVVVQVAPWHS